MAKTLDFNTLKKRYMTVKLADKEKTVLLVTTPTKRVFDRFVELQELLNEDIGTEALDELYDICAQILSCNKGGIEITKEKLEPLFDYEDIITLIEAYTEFVSELANSKN